MLKMGTRAASFSAKIRNLQDYHHRLLNGITPYPSIPDIINVLKFFSQALLTILRDVPCIPIDLIRDPNRDSIRIGFFPNLDYRNLFYTLSGMLDSFSNIQSALSSNAPIVFEYLLHAFVSLVPFLEHEMMDSMPLTVANTISLNFISHQDIIDMLCYNILPFTLYMESKENDSFDFANASIPSILMTVLSHTDSLSLHSQLLECLMRLKSNIIQDLLVVIAYGTGKARHASVELLFQYWPGLNPSSLDRKNLSEKHVIWKPLTCQNDTCQNTLNNEAVKICFTQIDQTICSSASGGGVSSIGAQTATAMTALPTSIDLKGRPPIPLLICIECAELVREQNSLHKAIKSQDILLNVLHPMTEISYTCESKSCVSSVGLGSNLTTKSSSYQHTSLQQAVVTCFSTECTSFNCNKPVRLCQQCHQQRHLNQTLISASPNTNQPRLSRHLVQEHLQSFWQLPLEAQQHFTEAVVSLLREAAAIEKSSKESERYVRTHTTGAYTGIGPIANVGSELRMGGTTGSVPGGAGTDGLVTTSGAPGTGIISSNIAGGGCNITVNSDASDSTIEERQLLSRYGIWLMIGLVNPAEATTNERMKLLGRMLAMLCQWFHNTACLPDDQAGSALERIKSESIHGWLMKVIESQFCLFANCLVPSPPDHAQIGGHWECWPSMTNQIKEGFKRLLCLVPYDIITPDIWSYIMPFWMESFRYDLAEDELSELKILLSKVLDPDLSPLGLEADVMYRFISKSFDNQLPGEQERALSWLQILTLLEIPVPMYLLQQMFLSGIKSFLNFRELSMQQQKTNNDLNKQTERLNGFKIDLNTSLKCTNNNIPQSASMQLPPISIENIAQSQMSCYVLMLDIIVKQFEYLPDQPGHKGFNDQTKIYQKMTLTKMRKDDSDFGFNTLLILYEMIHTTECTLGPHTCVSSAKRPPDTSQMFKPDSILNECFFCELCSIWYQLSLQILTLFAPVIEMTIMPDLSTFENIEFESNFYKNDEYFQQINSLNEMKNEQDKDESKRKQEEDENEEQWMNQLTLSERLTLKLLKELQVHNDPDVLYHLLQCLKLLTLHCGVFVSMAKQEQKRMFFFQCQKKYLITSLWRLLQAEFSQISQIAVPLLIHCIALPGGLSVMTKMIDDEFRSEDWCARFAAIERMATFSQFIDQSLVKNSSLIQSALSSLFIHMIHALDDINSSVAQRALTALELMRATSIKVYVMCMEIQFDLVIVDRCLVLSSLLQLFNHLNERRVLTWEFFLNRFDALFLEAQVFPTKLSGDYQATGSNIDSISEPTRDLRNTNVHSETYKKKITRTHEALTQVHIKRSLLPHHFFGRNEKRHLLLLTAFGNSAIHGTTIESSSNVLSAKQSTIQNNSIICGTQDFHSVQSTSKANIFNKLYYHQQQFANKSVHHHRSEKIKNLTTANQLAINRKSSKLAALTGSAFPNNFFQETGQTKQDLAQEELQLFNIVHKTLDDLDYCDQETLHLLVFLFMQFLSWPDPQHPIDDISLTKTQIIVLRHLNTLLGYSMSENVFLLNAYDLRKKSVFSSFLSALPDVLDLNLSMGNLLLNLVFPIMVYCPAKHDFMYVSDIENFSPNYSIWLLQSHLRRSWLSSLIIILYKYNYAGSTINGKFVQHLIQIVYNTLETALEHKCNPDATVQRRSREQREIQIKDVPEELANKTCDSADDTITTMSAAKMILTADIMQNPIKPINGQTELMMSEQNQLEQMQDEELNVMLMLIDKAKEFERQEDQQQVKKEVIKEIDKIKVEKVAVEIFQNISEKSNRKIEKPESGSGLESATKILPSSDSPLSSSASLSASVPIEKLLPVGGELSESVRNVIKKKPYPSMIQDTRSEKTGPTVKPSCCCCCAAASNQVCCLNYQQTIDAFRNNLILTNDQSAERLLPIGPHHSRSHTVASSRSAERSSLKQARRSHLIRQHTTIATSGALNSINENIKKHHLSSSKSMNSMDKPKLVIAKIRSEPEPELRKSQIISPTSPLKESVCSTVVFTNKKEPMKLKCETNISKNLSPLKSASSPNLNGIQKEFGSNTHTQPSSPTKQLNKSIEIIEKTTLGTKEESKRSKSKQSNKKKSKKNSSKKLNADSIISTVAITAATNTLHSFSTPSSVILTTTTVTSTSEIVPELGLSKQAQENPLPSSIQPKSDLPGRSNESTNSDIQLQQFELCSCCGMPIEKFDEHELGLCIVALATFVHRNPTLAAPLLPQILKLASRYALRCVFPWQMESNVHLPGNTASIARQFIRCTLHQLNSNGIFRQLFQTHSGDIILFRSIAISLVDFIELNQVTPLKELFEALTEDKQLPPLGQILLTLSNVATYFECVFVDYNSTQSSSLSTVSPIISNQYGSNVPVLSASIVANQPWSDLISPLENYLRRLALNLAEIAPSIHNLVPLMRVLLAVFKIPGIGAHRSILDPISKIITHIFQHSPILLEHVRDLCIQCNRAYVRDRDRFCVARIFAQELIHALRFRTQVPDENIFTLVQWALEDAGGSLPYSIAAQSLERNQNSQLGLSGITIELPSTNAIECLRCFIPELLDFIGDLHALAKLKSNFQGTSIHLNQETLGGNLKAGIAQFLALELTRIGGSDSKTITKYLPWLYSLPSIQNGPKEFSECISHVRLLSWILLGSLQHTALMKCHPSQSSLLVSQPIPLDVSNHVAEHVHVILAGFGAESKSSVVHMSALFYAFLLCQLWTVYCEQLASQSPAGSDAAHQNILVLIDFWTKVTPGILQIISHSISEIPQLADTITLHFLFLMETLMECNSEILARLLPLWLPFFSSYPGQLTDLVSSRLKTLISWPVPAQTKNEAMMLSTVLIRWLQRIQARMSQIEIQSSTVTQFYCV